MNSAGPTVWFAAASLMVCGAAPRILSGRAQQQPTFRSEINAVVVDASVRDRSRRAVTNLQPADFVVIDNVALVEGSQANAPLALTLDLSTYYRTPHAP